MTQKCMNQPKYPFDYAEDVTTRCIKKLQEKANEACQFTILVEEELRYNKYHIKFILETLKDLLYIYININ